MIRYPPRSKKERKKERIGFSNSPFLDSLPLSERYVFPNYLALVSDLTLTVLPNQCAPLLSSLNPWAHTARIP